MLIPKIKCKK